MKKHLPGFMLIELIVATLIASMIGSLLLTVLYQSNQIQVAVDDMINISERIGIAVSTLEKDLAGAFVPTQSSSAKATADEAEKADNEKKTTEQKNKATEKTPEKKEPKPIEKIFYSTSKNGMLDTLTFVTNNPLVVFVGKDVGVVKPKVVRVQYTLKPQPENKDSYTLFRQESNELDLAEYKNVRSYEVISGIKKLSITFTARIEKSSSAKATADKSEKKNTEQTTKENKKKEYEYKTQPEWVSEQKEDKNKESDKQAEFPRIPHSVEFKMILWDKESKREKEFTFVCSIPVDSIEAQLKDKKQSALPKKEQQNEDATDKSKQSTSKGSQTTHVQTHEVVVYNGIEAVSTALDSLKKLFGHG